MPLAAAGAFLGRNGIKAIPPLRNLQVHCLNRLLNKIILHLINKGQVLQKVLFMLQWIEAVDQVRLWLLRRHL